MSELKVVDLAFSILFSILFLFILDLGLGFSVISHDMTWYHISVKSHIILLQITVT